MSRARHSSQNAQTPPSAGSFHDGGPAGPYAAASRPALTERELMEAYGAHVLTEAELLAVYGIWLPGSDEPTGEDD